MNICEPKVFMNHLIAAIDLQAVEGLQEFHECLESPVSEVATPQGEDVDVLRPVWVVLRTEQCEFVWGGRWVVTLSSVKVHL